MVRAFRDAVGGDSHDHARPRGSVLRASGLAHLIGLLLDYAALPPIERSAARDEGVTTIVKSLDGFFICALLLIVAFDLYELFIGKIEAAETSEVGARLLKITSLEELKERVVKLVILILVIEFFQRLLRLSYDSALEIFYLAAAILLVSGGTYLIGHRERPKIGIKNGRFCKTLPQCRSIPWS